MVLGRYYLPGVIYLTLVTLCLFSFDEHEATLIQTEVKFLYVQLYLWVIAAFQHGYNLVTLGEGFFLVFLMSLVAFF